MATGRQRGERVPRLEVPCSTEGCLNTVRMTANRAKWATRYKVFCPACRVVNGIEGGGRPATGRWILCANPSCPTPDTPVYKRPSEKGDTCSRSCAAKMRTDRGKNPITLRRLSDKVCPVCNASFRPETISQIYDKPECRDIAHRTIDRTPRACLGCQKEFIPEYHNQKFHTQECRRNRVTKSCEICGQGFSDIPSKMKTRRWCPEHQRVLAHIKNAMFDHPWHNGKPKIRVQSKSANSVRWYVQIWEPDHPNAFVTGWMSEHVWVVCQRDGLEKIPNGFHVHHEDDNGMNNDPSNLVLLPHGGKDGHAALTARANAKDAASYKGLLEKLKAAGIDPETLS